MSDQDVTVDDVIRAHGLWIDGPSELANAMARNMELLISEIASLREIAGGHVGACAQAIPPQHDVLRWAIDSFGPIARNRDERAARLAEEAIEIAQAEGVPLDVIERIASRVYSRPVGEPARELGGLAITALGYAENTGLSFAACAQAEWQRVQSKPKDWWQRKHAEKVAAGTADLSPVGATDSSAAPEAVATATGA